MAMVMRSANGYVDVVVVVRWRSSCNVATALVQLLGVKISHATVVVASAT